MNVKDMIERFATNMHDRGIIILDDVFFQTSCFFHVHQTMSVTPDLKPFRWFDNIKEKMRQREANRNKSFKWGTSQSDKKH